MQPLIRDRVYLVVYRVSIKTSIRGTREERYDALIKRLQAERAHRSYDFFADRGHVSTSAWMIQSIEATAEALRTKLFRGLSSSNDDLLDVFEIDASNIAVTP